ncbi:MAG: sugar ABC transporter substrate-binding protein [Phycisphaerae bacterium]|nr:sugar ABC transporter substrate-binding protein [Phycisphaerae bacterium]
MPRHVARHIAPLLLAALAAPLGCARHDAGAGATIELWTYLSGGSTDRTTEFWQEVARKFERANPGVRVSVVSDIPHNYYMSMLGTRFIGRNPPDVMIMDDVDIGDLAREGMLTPLESFIASDPTYRSADYAPSMVRDSYVRGVRYSVPWYGSFVQITYRRDLFEQAGVAPPKTWDELLAVCRTFQTKLDMPHPFGMPLNGSFWMINWAWQNGASVLSPDHRRVTVDTPEFIEAVQFVHDLMHKHRVMDPALAGGAKVSDMWSTGGIAMMMDGAFMIGRYDALYPRWQGKWALAPLPAGKHHVSFYGGAHLVMSAATKRAALAWRFMVFATSAENQMMYADMLGSPPASMKVFDLPAFRERHPHLVAMRSAIDHGRNNPLAPFFPKIWYDLFRNRVIDVVMNDPEADVAAAVRSAARDMQRVADDYWARHPELAAGGASR